MTDVDIALITLAIILLPFVLALVLVVELCKYLRAKRKYYEFLLYAGKADYRLETE